MKAIFISFEGPEGAGKSTAIEKILPILSEQREVLSTREPGGARIAEDIRNIILDPKNTSLDGKTEMLLFAAARRVHLLEKVKPALEAGKLVLVDRFIDSSVAYQGYAGGLAIKDVEWLNHFATDGLKPDLTFFFDIAPEEGLARVMSNDGREKNRLDLASLDFHKKVAKGYHEICQAEPERFSIIDASKSPEEISELVLERIYQKFPDEFAFTANSQITIDKGES